MTVVGRGSGKLTNGAFPEANRASGTITIDSKVSTVVTVKDSKGKDSKKIVTKDESETYHWQATRGPEVGSPVNNLYRTWIWTFKSPLGTATATMRGSATGAAGTAHGWTHSGVKIKFGVQFAGENVRILTMQKAF